MKAVENLESLKYMHITAIFRLSIIAYIQSSIEMKKKSSGS